MDSEKLNPVRWVGSSLKDLKSFPPEVKAEVGHALYAAQQGDTDPAAKPLNLQRSSSSRRPQGRRSYQPTQKLVRRLFQSKGIVLLSIYTLGLFSHGQAAPDAVAEKGLIVFGHSNNFSPELT